MPGRLKLSRPIKGADVEVRFARQSCAFAGQRRAAPGAKSPPCSSRCRIKFRYFAGGDRIRAALVRHEDRDRCAAVLPATLAVAPINPFGLTESHKPYRPADAPALELLAHMRPRPSSLSAAPAASSSITGTERPAITRTKHPSALRRKGAPPRSRLKSVTHSGPRNSARSLSPAAVSPEGKDAPIEHPSGSVRRAAR